MRCPSAPADRWPATRLDFILEYWQAVAATVFEADMASPDDAPAVDSDARVQGLYAVLSSLTVSADSRDAEDSEELAQRRQRAAAGNT